MKKKAMVLVVIVIVVMTGLSNIALSLVKDPQWTPYVQSWNRKLPAEKKKTKTRTKKTDPITMCNSAGSKTLTTQR